MTKEEAIEVYNGLINQKIKEAFEFFAPELAESEDEKIRKHLIEIVETYWGKTNEPGKAADLAWLEKQKEQKSELTWQDVQLLDFYCMECQGEESRGEKEYENSEAFFEDVLRRFNEKMKEQKPVEWNKKPCLTCQEYKKGFEAGRLEGLTAGYNKAVKEMEQKEQKPIIQDVELNDAVYDYVRDHFIPGADFTPEYIKKLMENAFFAGVDYYLLKQESESCEPDTNVEKVIENVIRVYGKTQGEWVGGYDVDTLIVNLRRAFNKKEPKPAEWSEEDEKMKLFIFRMVNTFYNWTRSMGDDCEQAKKAVDWVRNLSQRPQPEWKPNEEQMEALNKVRTLNPGLDTLYQQLKNL